MAWRRVDRAIGGLKRIFGESGEDVGQQQLLMLLLMLDAELDQAKRFGGEVGQRSLKRLVDRLRATRALHRGSAG